MGKYICIHGHFYQPPRENPWLEEVELQDPAYPYHDWNERITEECYRQNAASRILGDDRKIVNIVNNYASISFNFGPTLLSWLQKHAPDVYQKILDADKAGMERFSGHGSAVAQAYNHMILPLSNPADKHTQVMWGIRDFEKRFERRPEGMWLPETAVNTDTLEVLAEHGIRFTVLAPRQAQKIRKIGGKKWKEVSEETLDSSIPYVCHLPSGRSIALFFYCGSVSHDVAYGGLLHSGEAFAKRIHDAFPPDDGVARLIHIATDGESFGHHHRHGDMALAYCLHHIETHGYAQLTNYGEFLDKFPPDHEVVIRENSSWSCAHGIERWKNNCGCSGDAALAGRQHWRAPLRESLDWLRDRLAGVFDEMMRAFVADPWATRNAYIDVILDRSDENVRHCVRAWTGRDLTGQDLTVFIKLLEMQRNAMLMYTSCGWFFDDIMSIEGIQILLYAGRAIQLCRELKQLDLEPEFIERLSHAPAVKNPQSSGRDIYHTHIRPAMIDLERVGAHFALCSVFQECEPESMQIFAYAASVHRFQRLQAGIQALTVSNVSIRSKITREEKAFAVVGLYLGGQNLFATLGPMPDPMEARQSEEAVVRAFRSGDTNEVMRLMNVLFSGDNYSISHLFKDEQRRILHTLLSNTWQQIESAFRHIYEHNYSIMQLMCSMNMPLPKALSAPAEFVVHRELCRLIRSPEVDARRIKTLLEEVERFSLALDKNRIQFEFNKKICGLFFDLKHHPEDSDVLARIEEILEILENLDIELNLQNSQNIFFTIAQSYYPSVRSRAEAGDKDAEAWIRHFRHLARQLDLVIA